MRNLFSLILGLGVFAVMYCDSDVESSIRDIVMKRRYLNYARNILTDLNNRLDTLHKRSCLLNLPGMDCDYGDISGSGKDQGYWTNSRTPGKKRRSPNFCSLGIGNTDECLAKQLKEDMADMETWNNKLNPGRK